jgi:thiamine-phosphate pyrophosphorylase
MELAPFAGDLARALDAGDVAALQLRLKNVGDDDWRRAIAALKPIAEARDVAFIVNDRPDLAKEMDADGVHIGQEDADYGAARALLGPDKIVGVTCHASRHLAMKAAEQGADYVAFGSFYPTTTKSVSTLADPEILRWWNEVFEIPSVAIGGITVENCAPLVEAGADFLAVIAGVWHYPSGPAAAVKAFTQAIANAGGG